jgi:non-heme chloroperoxidase
MRWSKIRIMAGLLVVLCSSSSFGASKGALITEGFEETSTGIVIHYLEAGPSKSPRALVLIPGWRLPAFLWTAQLKKFGTTERVIAIDPRSQGESSITTYGNTPEDRAKDLRDVLNRMGVSRFVLVGWSQGVQDVAAYIEQFGTDSLAGVVLVDSPVAAGPDEIDLRPALSKAVLGRTFIYAMHAQQYSEGMVHALFEKPHSDAEIQSIVKSTLKTPTDVGIAMLVADLFGSDRRPALAKLNKPALVIASASSPELDAQKEMAARIHGARFLAIEGTRHAVFVDEPERFDQALEEFLQAVQW